MAGVPGGATSNARTSVLSIRAGSLSLIKPSATRKKALSSAYGYCGDAMTTLTARQRRQTTRDAFEQFFESCPSRQVLDQLSNKWVAICVLTLSEGPMRHAELARAIPSVTQKMLTQTLRALERDGMVHRAVEPTVPVSVTYSLTELGESLLGLLDSVVQWSDRHIDEIERSRSSHVGWEAGAAPSS